ncbi:hypothetical protein CVT26_003227 [Gymnopilus dilepis]|uniref:Enoyl reductase (ER) domain-containing protein n=1 Tax=Gymnopilus dilepis TaxID=231916 RepID=A0A409Y5E2_9AGAR|nr:hypothetical protein CVT26_003227 [Gymnopilus dilepis]
MSATQKALVLPEKFGQFTIQEAPIPSPGPGELVIKVQAAALNPVDWKIRKYDIEVGGYPAVVGYDLAGDVETVGDGVVGFHKGDRVFTQAVVRQGFHGSFQQYFIAEAPATAKVPPGFSYDEVSTIPVALSTAYTGLYAGLPNGLGIAFPEDSPSKYSDTPILILGGASSVGQVVIQLAKYSGFNPIITTASLQHENVLKEFGATHVLDRRLTIADLQKEVSKIAGKPVEFVYDSISLEATQQAAFEVVAPGGRVALVLPPVVEVPEGKHVAGVHAGLKKPHNHPLLYDLYHDKAYNLVASGVVKPNRFEVLPNGLAGIPDGLARLEADQVSRLKLVAHPQETP